EPDILGPQMQLVGRPIEAEPDSRDRDPEPVSGPGQGAFDIGHQPVEFDRTLHQPPNPEAGNEDQHPDDRAEPDQDMVGVLADAPGGGTPGGAARVVMAV